MEAVLQLLESIPEKVVNHNQNCQKLKQMVKLCLQDYNEYTVEPTNNFPECIQILCTQIHDAESDERGCIPMSNASKIRDAVSSLKSLFSDGRCCLTYLLNAFLTNNVIEWVLGIPEDLVSSNELNYFSQLAITGQLSRSTIRSLALVHLIKLTSTHDLNQIIPMTQVPEFQSKKWRLSLTHLPLKSLLTEVVAVIGAEDVLRCTLSCLGKPQVNWRILLLLTSSVLLLEDGIEKSSAFIDQLLRRGLECDNAMDLGASLLFARQCCHEATPEFGTYSQWFSAHFGAGSTSARSANQYQSLLQLLVSLVPAEPPAMLRVHLNAVPKAPTSCHSLLRDYTELARARLDDLKEPAEMEGLFLDSYDGEQDTRCRDLERVLEHFSRTEKVLKVVLEAAVFRRKYFEGVFLVELLQLPGWSEQVASPEVNSVRHAFIEKLRSLEKIPAKLYTAFQNGVGADLPSTRNKLAGVETDSGQKSKKKNQIKKKR